MLRILVVDDLLANRIFITELLMKVFPKFEVIEAKSGREGVKLALNQNPDMILLDEYMPEMDGYETARLLGAIPETSKIPIIGMILTESQEWLTSENMRPFCQALLLKPLSTKNLYMALQRILGYEIEKNGLYT